MKKKDLQAQIDALRSELYETQHELESLKARIAQLGPGIVYRNTPWVTTTTPEFPPNTTEITIV